MSAAADMVTPAARRGRMRPAPRPASDAELGMIWWNRLTKIERMAALLDADTTVPAEAWARWKLTNGASP